ncbi:hypothetical protein HZB01_02600 [Candidatus Woesearchaeota archaeon]|nr:hypothetical protein [Candidatus Woesearchaeota archaeon]
MSKEMIEKILKEIRHTFTGLILFEQLLNAILAFLLVYFVLFMFGIPPLYGAIPAAAIYFILNFTRRVRGIDVDIIEKKYPQLNERLRTVRDSLDQNNFIVEKLRDEVDLKMSKVTVGSFFDMKQSFLKIGAVCLLCFMIIFTSIFNLRLINDMGEFITTAGEKAVAISSNINDFFEGNAEGNGGDGGGLNGAAIFGSKSKAELGKDEVLMQMQYANDEIDYSREKQIEDQQFEERFLNSRGFEGAVDATYKEEYSKTDRKVIKSYFMEIANNK